MKLQHSPRFQSSRLRRQRGQTIVISALAFLLLIAAVGLAIDFGGATNVRRNDQNAADAAALAAAVVINQGQDLPTASDRANTATTKSAVPATALTMQYLKGDGSPATTGAQVKKIRATVSETWGTYFIRLVGFPTINISALAEVSIPKPCALCLLDPGASPALNLSANGGINVSGGDVQVNSSANPAVVLSASGSINAPGTNVVGSVSQQSSGTINPAASTGVVPVPDPLAALPYPSGPLPNNGRVDVGDANRTINPGLYTQWALGGAGNLYLNPGTYVITGPAGESVSVSSAGGIRGTGVTLFFTCANFPAQSCTCPGGAPGSNLKISSDGGLQISAPTSGTYAGVAIFFDRCNTGAIELSANGSTPVTGAIYAKSSALLLTANGNMGLAGLVVVGTATLSGNGGINLAYNPSDPAQRVGAQFLTGGVPRLSR
jgi:Flp pilus assembly protein TadG